MIIYRMREQERARERESFEFKFTRKLSSFIRLDDIRGKLGTLLRAHGEQNFTALQRARVAELRAEYIRSSASNEKFFKRTFRTCNPKHNYITRDTLRVASSTDCKTQTCCFVCFPDTVWHLKVIHARDRRHPNSENVVRKIILDPGKRERIFRRILRTIFRSKKRERERRAN